MAKLTAISHGTKIKCDRSEIKNERELFIIQEFAQLKSVPQVTEACNKKFTNLKPLSVYTINYYKRTRAPVIAQLRDEIINKAMEVPIANEKTRLQRTEKLYQVATTILAKKDRVETSLHCLKEAREEVKGESGSTQNFLQFNQYNEFTNEELMEKKRELERKFIELSKKGVNSYEVKSP